MAEKGAHTLLAYPVSIHEHAPRIHMLPRYLCWHVGVSSPNLE